MVSHQQCRLCVSPIGYAAKRPQTGISYASSPDGHTAFSLHYDSNMLIVIT